MKRNRESKFVIAATSGLITFGATVGASHPALAADDPGLASGNRIELPVNAPINICGNTLTALGYLNSTSGISCTKKPSTSTRAVTPTIVPVPLIDPIVGAAAASGTALGAAGAAACRRRAVRTPLPLRNNGWAQAD